jgi:hypothetical protein
MDRQRGPDRPTLNSFAHFATVCPCRLQRHWVRWVSATTVLVLPSDGGSLFSARVLATEYRPNDHLEELVVDRQILDISSIPGYCDARHDVSGRSPPKRLHANSGTTARIPLLAGITPWTHVEAGMAYGRGLPRLLLREPGVYKGAFDNVVNGHRTHVVELGDC